MLAFVAANALLAAGLLSGPVARASGTHINADTVDGFHAVKESRISQGTAQQEES